MSGKLFFISFQMGMDFLVFISNSSRRVSIITCGVAVSLNELKQMCGGKAWLSSAAVGAAGGTPTELGGPQLRWGGRGEHGWARHLPADTGHGGSLARPYGDLCHPGCSQSVLALLLTRA